MTNSIKPGQAPRVSEEETNEKHMDGMATMYACSRSYTTLHKRLDGRSCIKRTLVGPSHLRSDFRDVDPRAFQENLSHSQIQPSSSKFCNLPASSYARELLCGAGVVHCVEIRRITVPRWVENGTKDSVILDCEYVYNENDLRLVVKWFFENNTEPIYQWIPELNTKHTHGLFKERVDLNYSVNPVDAYSQFRALKIQPVSKELSGKYTCLVTSLAGQDSRSQHMTVFVFTETYGARARKSSQISHLAAMSRLLCFIEEYILDKSVLNQLRFVAQKVKEYESKLAAPCDDKMSQSSTSDVKRQIKLPKFELKKYTGELEEWLSWWSHFEKIHLDESLSDVDKFEYLIQSMVVGSKAHRLVTSFPLTQKNYNKVIGDLKDRCGDRDMLTELYVRKLLKLVIASARSEKRTLAQLYDDLVAHLHSLGSLGVDTKSGGGAFLYPLVESSLPLELIKIWQRSRTPFKERDYSEIEEGIEHSGAKAFDKLEGLIEFLKQEVKNAERISFVAEGFEPSLPLKQGKRENNPPKIHTASALFVGKTNLPCLFCDKDNHLSQNCFKAAKMLESDRLKRVQDAKVCFKCLRKNHLKKDCRSFVRCKRCQGPHFEIMCRGTSHSQENLNWRSDNRSHNSLAEQNEGISEPVTAMANQVCTNNISLMTLIVKIKGPKRSKMVRVLLDSGSQKSYIRRSLAKELDLPKVGEVKLNKFLFGGQTTGEKAHSIFYFQLDNVDEGKAFKMEALEETIICGNISPVETGPRQWELDKKGITLTKVDNNKTEIDILIGGGLLWATSHRKN
ncbi:hypothetical protein LAZ67_8001558 [Cordylochernes scorpioides]|uniref:Ig-like domain-containing protein n=1 Tax=Cordylochernes scorpioides TaxID=51811 RepID=A0ABY6KVD2_9ARAC|nr:hypothetical protein LAZ67_8001558 [Cordylochernes scorpioides]